MFLPDLKDNQGRLQCHKTTFSHAMQSHKEGETGRELAVTAMQGCGDRNTPLMK